jgi:N utilization substance protein B
MEPDTCDFMSELIRAYFSGIRAIDTLIEERSDNWKLGRMASVDRNLLRLGACEILYLPDVPKSVSINEYLEIAKKFGTEDSSSFINGILDKIVKPDPLKG